MLSKYMYVGGRNYMYVGPVILPVFYLRVDTLSLKYRQTWWTVNSIFVVILRRLHRNWPSY